MRCLLNRQFVDFVFLFFVLKGRFKRSSQPLPRFLFTSGDAIMKLLRINTKKITDHREE